MAGLLEYYDIADDEDGRYILEFDALLEKTLEHGVGDWVEWKFGQTRNLGMRERIVLHRWFLQMVTFRVLEVEQLYGERGAVIACEIVREYIENARAEELVGRNGCPWLGDRTAMAVLRQTCSLMRRLFQAGLACGLQPVQWHEDALKLVGFSSGVAPDAAQSILSPGNAAESPWPSSPKNLRDK